MNVFPEFFKSEEELDEALSRPSAKLVEFMGGLDGDIIFLGVSGKMGISMALMAKRACERAEVRKRVIGVSRFSSPENKFILEKHGVETIAGDLTDIGFVESLPKVENVVYLAGTKFGTKGNESYTWAMNAFLPGIIVENFKNSKIVALSTGCVYPQVDVQSSGSIETDKPGPIGEYAQSCLGRERLFEYGSLKNGTHVSLIRLNYAVEMRYGVLIDIASKIGKNQPIDLDMGYFNAIWQGDANDLILRSFSFCAAPPTILNITGPEKLSVRTVATKLGEFMGKKVSFQGQEDKVALLSDATRAFAEMDSPNVSTEQLLKWTAHWMTTSKRTLGKPTHYEIKNGDY
jgi:nucleoside-diphosphate-sugar epimerase